jgi:hypothetical protein
LPFPLLNPSSGSVYKLNPTTSFLATFRTSAPLALCVARLLPHGAHPKTPSYTTCLLLLSTVSDRIALAGTSLGFLKDLPSTDTHPRILSQKDRNLSFEAPLRHGPRLPSPGFLTLLTAYSSRTFAGLLHPATGSGVHHVLHPSKTLSSRTSATHSP